MRQSKKINKLDKVGPGCELFDLPLCIVSAFSLVAGIPQSLYFFYAILVRICIRLDWNGT